MGAKIDSKRVMPGPFKMGWILVMFDLPVGTKEERKIATGFRKQLLKDGYQMLQYSIYMRFTPNFERMRKHAKRVEYFAPDGGNIKVLFITDKQWEKAISIIGESYMADKKPIEQHSLFEFW